MKLAIVLVILASLCFAGSAGAYVVNISMTPNGGGTSMITTINDNYPTSWNNPTGSQTWFLLPTNQGWVSGDPGQLNSRMNSTTKTSWTFAAFVEDPIQNPTMTIKIYGANSTYISDLLTGCCYPWSLKDKKTDRTLAYGFWQSYMTNQNSPLLTYTFTDTSFMVGPQNAVSLWFGQEIPEPSSILALLTGIGGFGLIFRRRFVR